MTCQLQDMCERYAASPRCENPDTCDYYIQLLNQVYHPEKRFSDEDLEVRQGDMGLVGRVEVK